ncbi:ADP-ribosyl-(dinitrogen reductase) hydrolase [Comamonas aquatica]|uniref:ADP-ribosyl-(dinitrogen reductase) hydrolase n=1 Tax=Comamonas aquatica TaxID=225991 RepID=UPI0028D33F95|nr:ADP-ribosyl-(dinitrogen reductase) hydrolase [Comamonas aquatica]
MNISISPAVLAKLADPSHNVTKQEILECFANRDRKFLTDNRPQHQAPIPTQWFVAETDYGRLLKVVFMYDRPVNTIIIKSAYPAEQHIVDIYHKHAPMI